MRLKAEERKVNIENKRAIIRQKDAETLNSIKPFTKDVQDLKEEAYKAIINEIISSNGGKTNEI